MQELVAVHILVQAVNGFLDLGHLPELFLILGKEEGAILAGYVVQDALLEDHAIHVRTDGLILA